jgi:hypothetical protein
MLEERLARLRPWLSSDRRLDDEVDQAVEQKVSGRGLEIHESC